MQLESLGAQTGKLADATVKTPSAVADGVKFSYAMWLKSPA